MTGALPPLFLYDLMFYLKVVISYFPFPREFNKLLSLPVQIQSYFFFAVI